MQLSRKALEVYNATIKSSGNKAEKAARNALERWFLENPEASVEQTRDFCISLLRELGTVYGQAAGNAAYALREAAAQAAGVELPAVVYDYVPEADSVTQTAHYQATKLVDGDTEGFKKEIGDAARYYAERGANQTMTELGKADGKKLGKVVRFARVPTGVTTCSYCCMLASRGFVYRSELTALNANHRNCDCRIVEGFAGMTVEGYNPAYYYDVWKHPEKYEQQKVTVSQSPDVPSLNKTLTDTSIEESARLTNPNVELVNSARQRMNDLAAELNAMMPITSENIVEYTEKYSTWEDLNKEYKKLYKKWHQNCQRCVPAYELRRRGYDVTAAQKKSRNDTVRSDWKNYFKGQEWRDVGSNSREGAILNLETEISAGGNGSRYAVAVWWQGRSAGHTFIAENVGDRIRYIDPQDDDLDFSDWKDKFSPSQIITSRIDTLEFDEQYIGSVVVVSK